MTPLVLVLHSDTRRSYEVKFKLLVQGYAERSGEKVVVDEIRVSDEVPRGQVYLCKRTDLTISPIATEQTEDWQ